VPVGLPSFAEALRAGTEVFHHLKADLHKQKLATAVGGRRWVSRPTSRRPRPRSTRSWRPSASRATGPVGMWRSPWTSRPASLYRDGAYRFEGEGVTRSGAEMIDFLAALVEQYPIVSIEDGLDENAWTDWKALTTRLGGRVQLVGDDLFVTKPRDPHSGDRPTGSRTPSW